METISGGYSRGRRKPVISGDLRERAIVDALEALLSQRPLGRIPVEEIARGAGLSRSAFYFYFASKEEVLLALSDRVIREMKSRTDPALEGLVVDPVRGWAEIINGVWETWRDHRDLMNACSGASSENPEVRRVWQDSMEHLVGRTAWVIQRERERGAAPASNTSARELATTLNWMNERMLYATFSGFTPSVSEEKLVPVLVETWIAAIYGRSYPGSKPVGLHDEAQDQDEDQGDD